MNNHFSGALPRNTPPFRADHVGSFLRPQKVKEARQQFAEGKIPHEALQGIENDAIKEIVDLQIQTGLSAVTDGELRRAWWHYDFFEGLDGIKKIATEQPLAFHGIQPKAEKIVLHDMIGFTNHAMLRDFIFLQSIVGQRAIPKVCIPSPAILHMVLAIRDEKFKPAPYYQSDDELIEAIANAYSKAIQAFYAAGCRYLQLDDTSWGSLCSEDERAKMKSRGIDPDRLSARYVELLNTIAASKPSDMTLTMHICRGNFRSTWLTSGGYEPVAAQLFGKANLDGFFLEYDSDRAGDFTPLRHIKNQQVVLGIISSKTGQLESKNSIKKRIAEAAEYVPINQLCLSTQCGFSSTEEGNIITEEEQWLKLGLVVATAKEVWG